MAHDGTLFCVAHGCKSTAQDLKRWLESVCFHHRPSIKADCSCRPFYDFYSLPNDPTERYKWLDALGLETVPANGRVCSIHFSDWRPSQTHPYPEPCAKPNLMKSARRAAQERPERKQPPKANPDSLKTVHGAKMESIDSASSMESPAPDGPDVLHKCELCGTICETRRGLSSHARCHLRQLGVSVSESSGAPIELLYRLIQERDGQLPRPPSCDSPSKKQKGTVGSLQGEKETDVAATGDSGSALKTKPSSLIKKSCPTENPTLSVSPLRKKPAQSAFQAAQSLLLAMDTSPPPVEVRPSPAAKPHWAPRDTDSPLCLVTTPPADNDEEAQMCDLCDAWFETRKGLSSHARAHLRSFGVDTAEAKFAPIEALHQFMISKGLQPSSASLSPATSGKRPAAPFPHTKALARGSIVQQPTKRFRPSDEPIVLDSEDEDELTVKSEEEVGRNFACELCGELFNRKQSLASHARSHLRQMGVTDWMAEGSALSKLRQIMDSKGIPSILKLSNPSPSSTLYSPVKTKPLPPTPLTNPSPLKNTPSSSKIPKARKGFRPVNTAKDEPQEVSLNDVARLSSGSEMSQDPPRSNSTAGNSQSPIKVLKQEQDVNGPVECSYCNEMFDSRKALSCHARAHLRQLGARWPAQASPIDALHQLMQREGMTRAADVKLEPSSPRRASASPGAFTPPTPPQSYKGAVVEAFEATCELCGFDFENRKALASHARAHLRQQGVEWSNGSPIETLSTWMQKEPGKVAELHKRYMMGELPNIRKRSSASPCPSSDSEVASSVPRGASRAPASKADKNLSSQMATAGGKGHKNHGNQGSSHSEANSRPARGGDRRSAKHSTHTISEVQESIPPKTRSGTIPSLVPKPPETPLVRQVGKVYSLKCRFCEKEFRGPLSVQEDWVRHLQEHILNLKQDEANKHTLPQASTTLLLTPQPV